jgi:hypothetical protein
VGYGSPIQVTALNHCSKPPEVLAHQYSGVGEFTNILMVKSKVRMDPPGVRRAQDVGGP